MSIVIGNCSLIPSKIDTATIATTHMYSALGNTLI